MKICNQCYKKIWFWNLFSRKYGTGFLLNKKDKSVRKLDFCSQVCLERYLSLNDGINTYY